ncbi:MAG: hypothetical protein HKM24_01680, partial [Gammaproteobacteria bacterium]|nr:hypothetical protein [Gammaproteobacteria bacterium]
CCLVIYLAGNGGRTFYDDVVFVRSAAQRVKLLAGLQMLSFLPLVGYWTNHAWFWYHGV